MMKYPLPVGLTLEQEFQLRQYYGGLPDEPEKLKHELVLAFAGILKAKAEVVLPTLPRPNRAELYARLDWLEARINGHLKGVATADRKIKRLPVADAVEQADRWISMREAHQVIVERLIWEAEDLARGHCEKLELFQVDSQVFLSLKGVAR
jgi:hypothetical protein